MGTGLYALTEEQVDLQRVIRQIADERVAPRAADIDEDGDYPQDLWELFREQELTGLPFDQAHGGTGTDTLMLAIAIEEVARASASTALLLVVQELGTLPLKLFGSAEQQERLLPRCASGEWSPALAFAEAGPAPTIAVRDADGWRISGTKKCVVGVREADFCVVFAALDSADGDAGSSAFVVESDRPGFAVGQLERRLGHRGVPTGQAIFDDVHVPDENLIGDEGSGAQIAVATLDRIRLSIAAQALGIAQAATDYAVGYASDRRQFGQSLNAFEGIQAKLTEMETRCAAARELLYRSATKADRGEPDASRYAAMAKRFCADAAMHASGEALQVLGGYGFIRDYPVERYVRDAKVSQVYEGIPLLQAE